MVNREVAKSFIIQDMSHLSVGGGGKGEEGSRREGREDG